MVNRVVIVGRLTRDPELRRSTSGVAVASFTVAVDDRFSKEPNGRANFLPVTCFQKTAEITCDYARKGSLVAIDGRLQQRSYENKDNQKVNVIEIIAESVQLLEPKNISEARLNSSDSRMQSAPSNFNDNRNSSSYNQQPRVNSDYQQEQRTPTFNQQQQPRNNDFEEQPFNNYDVSDDDLPF